MPGGRGVDKGGGLAKADVDAARPVGRLQVALELRALLEDEETLLAEEASPREVHLGHVTGDHMLEGTAERADAALEDLRNKNERT